MISTGTFHRNRTWLIFMLHMWNKLPWPMLPVGCIHAFSQCIHGWPNNAEPQFGIAFSLAVLYSVLCLHDMLAHQVTPSAQCVLMCYCNVMQFNPVLPSSLLFSQVGGNHIYYVGCFCFVVLLISDQFESLHFNNLNRVAGNISLLNVKYLWLASEEQNNPL